MGGYPENPGILPAKEFCNKGAKKNPINGKGPLGNQYAGQMSYDESDRKEQVKSVQMMLMELGFDIGLTEADGKFGDATEDGVKEFQKGNVDWESNPLNVDGLVGPRTSDALNREMVGRWYDTYQTSRQLSENLYCYTALESRVKEGLEINPGEAKSINLFIVQPSQGGFVPWIDLQTVDEFGHRLGEKTIILTYPDGKEKEVVTDEKGYHREKRVPKGKIAVILPDGTPAKMKSEDEEWDAVIDSEKIKYAIVNIIVDHGAPEQAKKQKGKNRKLYRRVPKKKNDLEKEKIASRNRVFDPDSGEFTGDDKQVLPRRFACVARDNLSLAAGDVSKSPSNFFKVLSEWLADYFPVAHERGYIVYVLRENELLTCDSKGKELGKCRVIAELEGRLFGAYSTFAEKTGPIFVDMVNQKYGITEKGKTEAIGLEEIVDDPDLMVKIHEDNLSKVKILYCLPTSRELTALAVLGGTGELEDYGQDQAQNDRIHKRNLAVINTIQESYFAYISGYVRMVQGKDEFEDKKKNKRKVENENDLRELGPPREPYVFPPPAGATEKQVEELRNDNVKHSSIRAWQAIAERLANFAGEIPEGSFFLSIKGETDKMGNPESPIINGGSVRINFYLENDLTPVMMKPETEVKLGGEVEKNIKTKTGKAVKVGFAYEGKVNDKGQFDESYKVKAGAGEIEISRGGDGKLEFGLGKVGGVYSEMSRKSAQFGMGGYFAFGENQKIYIGLHFQGLKDDTLLAFTCRGVPGFFQRRSIDELLSPRTQWGDLRLDEVKALEAIGFTQKTWDSRYESSAQPPQSIKKSFDDLTPDQKCAAVVLGLRRSTWEDVWMKIRGLGSTSPRSAPACGAPSNVSSMDYT